MAQAMAWMARLALALALAAAQRDEESVMLEANEAVELFCPVEFLPLNYAEARSNLEISAGKNNFIYTTVLEAEIGANGLSTQSLTATLEKTLDPGFVAGRAFAFVLLIVLLLLWLSCCWCFLIPCCMHCCCRCCEVHHQLGKKAAFHVCLWIVFLVLAATCVVAQSISFPSYANIDQGLQGTACYSAQLVKDAVNGNNASNFIGFVPAIQVLEQMVSILEPDSEVMQELESLLDLTEIIEKSTKLIFGVLENFLFLLEDKNQKPGGYMHTCQACIPVAERLGPLLQQLESGVAMALQSVRLQAKLKLQGPELESLRSKVQEIMGPLQETKVRILDQIGFFLSRGESGFQAAMEVVNGETSYLFLAILGLFVLCVLLVIHGIFSLAVFTRCGGRDHDPCCVRYSSGYSLCSSYCYTMLLLLLGGVMVIASTVGSGVCLVMLDFDKALGEKLLPSLGVPMNDQLDTALTMAHRCMSLTANESLSTHLLDIVTIPLGDPNGLTAREEIVDLVLVPLKDAFQQLETALNTQLPQVSQHEIVTKALAMLEDVHMKNLIWADVDQILESERYRLMNPLFYLITLNCPTVSLGLDLPPPYDGILVPGMNDMVDGWNRDQVVSGLRQDMATSSWTCPLNLTGECGTASDSTLLSQVACEAGTAFLREQKLPLANEPVFACRYFQLPGAPWGTRCDVASMVRENDTWTPDCFFANGSLETFVTSCTLDEYSAYVQEFSVSVRIALEYLDASVMLVLDTLQTRLHGLLHTHVLNPIDQLLGGFDCVFMRDFWSGLTSSLCLRSVSGFHTMSVCYLVAGLVSLLMASTMYVPWRISRDNEDIFEEQVHAAEAAHPVAAQELGTPQVQRVEVAPSSVPGTPEPGVPEAAAQANGSVSL